mgnify:CR=1 FL=1
MGQLPRNLGRGLIGVFNADNLGPLLVGGVAASAASFFDADTKQAAVGNLAWSDTFETAGGPLYSTLFVAGMFTAGRFVNSPRFRAMTYDMLDAAVVNFTYTEILKVAVGRERPNGQDNKSFPSGHTTQATVTYLSLAVVATALWRPRTLRIAVVAGAGLIALLVGLSLWSWWRIFGR